MTCLECILYGASAKILDRVVSEWYGLHSGTGLLHSMTGRQGCCVTQTNRALQVGLALASNTQMSSLTAIFTAALLASPKLPSILEINALRLAEAYNTLTSFLRLHGIKYIPVSHGPFVFARVAPNAVTWEDESFVIAACKEAGVILSSGRGYHIIEREKGWARLTFAIKRDQLDEALRRLEIGLGFFKSTQLDGDSYGQAIGQPH